MTTTTKLNSLENAGANGHHKPTKGNRIDPDEVKRLVRVGQERGLVALNAALPVRKDGFDLAQLKSVRSQWQDVTPAMAKAWLKNNFRNRPISEDVVTAYARDMIAGKWVPTHQGIAFNDKDELIDGQHRLQAIELSGCTIRMMVTFGLPARIDGQEMTTMDAVDRGRTRSVGDQLGIQHGMCNGSLTAAICAALSSLCYGERTRRLSVGQTLDVFRAFEPAVLYVIDQRSREVGLRCTGVLAAFAFAMMTEKEFEKVQREPVTSIPETRKKILATGGCSPVSQMFAQLNTGLDLDPGCAIDRLRGFLTSDEAKLITRSLDRGIAELALQAIYHQQRGEKPKKLLMVLDGANHFRAQQKERVEKVGALFKLPGQFRTSHKGENSGQN